MKKLILGLSMGCFLSMTSIAALAEPMYGVLMVVKGAVKVQNTSKQTTDAKVGGKVLEGDTVITGADARAKIVMADRNVINVNSDTQLVITKYENDAASGKKNVELNLLKGKVRNNVEQTYDGEKSKFLIKTPTAVAGVRGTQFLAGFNPQTQMTSIVTFKGSVTLASVGPQGNIIGKPVTVRKGESTQSAANMTPEAPKLVPKEEMKKMDGESTASNKGGETKRDVASEGAPNKEAAPTMIDSKDMDPNVLIKDPRQPAMTPSSLAAPTTVATPPPSYQLPRSGKSNVIVRPVPQN
jgi:hypothetical protein